MRGKAALGTGAANGIGRATALLFAREGARLVINDLAAERVDTLRVELADDGVDVTAVVGDASRPDDARAMVDAAGGSYGRIDVLVASAGIIPELDLLHATPEDFDHVMAVDGRGMFLTCQYAAERC